MKKLSKRLISVLLSALLIATSLPLFAFNAMAADTSALDDAMAAYEAKMDGNFYTNMTAAYDAYVAAAALKADENATAAQISSAASALTSATNNMGDFSGYAANGTVAYGSGENQPDGGAGILWANGASDTAYDQSQGGHSQTDTLGVGLIKYGAYYWFYYPTNTVLMYDGKTTPVLPVMMGAIDKDDEYNLHPRYVGVTSGDFQLTDYWYGYNDNFVWATSKDYQIGYNSSTAVGYDDAVEIDNESTVRSFSNYLTYNNTPTATLTTINGMTFYESHSMNGAYVSTPTSENKELDMTIPVKVINYKKLLDKLGQVGGIYNHALDKVGDYKEGGLRQLVVALDSASTDPNSFFTSSNGYQACADWIDASITAFDNVTVTMDPEAAQSIEGASTVLGDFEAILNNSQGKYYKNILPVYELYCKLHATVDAYEYGDGTSEAIGEASAALSAGIQGLQEFTPYTPTGTVTMKSDSTAVSDARYVSGLIGNYTASTSTMSYSSLGGTGTSPGGVYAYVNSPTSVVALYDGSSAIRIPVMTAWHNNMGLAIGTGNRRMMNAVYPSKYDDSNYNPDDNEDFELTQKWNGHTYDTWSSSNQANNAFRWSDAQNPASNRVGTLDGYSQATYNAADDDNYSENPSWQGQRSTTIWAYWNFMQYKGGNTGFSNGIKTVKINFYGMSKWPKAAIDTEGTHYFGSTSSPVTTVTIIDYKTPLDTFKANWSTQMAAFAAGEYDEGGFANVFAAFDDFTSYNGIASATPSNAATVASTLQTKANATGSATGTQNGTEYQALRDKIDWYPSAEKYVQGLSDPTYWTAESWQALIDAIDAAEAIMTALPTNNPYFYLNPSAATAAAEAIQTAYDNLVEAGVLIDPAVEAYVELISILDDYTYLASDLRTAASIVSNIQTAYYDAGPIGTKVPLENAAAIAAEAAALESAADALVKQTFDKGAYESYIEAAQRGVNDPDAYDINQLNSDIETLENAAFETVNFPHYGDIVGLKDNAQTAVDTAWAAVQSDLNTKMQYTVVVKDADGNDITNVGEGTYAYGTTVTINAGEGNYTYDYISNTANADSAHKVKNIGTVDSFTFTVQGNTTVTVGAPTNSKPITVTYRAELTDGESKGFVIGTDYVASENDVDVNAYKAPSYAFYKLDSRTKGALENNEITVTLSYSLAGNAPLFTVYNQAEESSEQYYLNELVTVQIPDAYMIATAASQEEAENFYNLEEFTEQFLTPLAYGDTYTFRAKENLYLVDLLGTGDEACLYTQNNENGVPSEVYVRSVENISGSSIVTYNAVALPDGYSIVEAGVLVQYNKTGADLADVTLDFNSVNQDTDSYKIRRLKASKIFTDEDNRFSITMNLGSGAKAKYLVYVNYTDENSELHTVFTDVPDDAITLG